MKVLIIDDDEIIAETISKKLKYEGFDSHHVMDGLQALDYINKKNWFDLILMDLMLPKLSGLKIMTIIKRHYKKGIPVVFMSSMNKGDVILSAIEQGARDFLIKPLNYDELILRIRVALNNKSTNNE